MVEEQGRSSVLREPCFRFFRLQPLPDDVGPRQALWEIYMRYKEDVLQEQRATACDEDLVGAGCQEPSDFVIAG